MDYYENLSLLVANHLRKGNQVGCEHSTFKNLKLHPDLYNLVVTNPVKVDKSRKLYFVGDFNDKSSVWKPYLEKNQSTWETA